jgi:succinate-semialdehyde dehydrogenase/glutarate-semialdehyde dehydrogenase
LGGHAPVIVCDDANLDSAVAGAVFNKFFNAGQICISPTRFYVQESVYETFVDKLSAASDAVSTGDGLDPKTQMGPLANSRRMVAMDRHLSDAVMRGARLKTGGHRIGKRGNYWQPTILSDVPDSAVIMNEEPFGPVAAIAPFKTIDQAVEMSNRLPYGLAAYAFTSSATQAALLADSIESGMVGINTFNVATPEAPFGGVKQSGYGSEGGVEGIDSYLTSKFVSQE